MRRTRLILIIALGLSMLAGLALNQVNGVSAQGDAPVGQVVAYNPGISITIVDQKGNQIEYALDPSLKFEPAEAEKSLKVGSFVTIIAPASLSKGKQVAVGIVVHPKAPAGWKDLAPTATPLVKNTAAATDTPLTATPKVSETPTPAGSASATPVGTLTVTPKPESSAKPANTFIEWLRSLFQQVLSQE